MRRRYLNSGSLAQARVRQLSQDAIICGQFNIKSKLLTAQELNIRYNCIYFYFQRDRSCIQSVHKFIDKSKKNNTGVDEIADYQNHIVAGLVEYNPMDAIKSTDRAHQGLSLNLSCGQRTQRQLLDNNTTRSRAVSQFRKTDLSEHINFVDERKNK